MSSIPDKWKITCPLDHSSYEKFIECNCNYGNALEVWWFKEKEIESLKSQLKQKDEEIKEKEDEIFRQRQNVRQVEIHAGVIRQKLREELIGVTEQLKQKDEEIEKLKGLILYTDEVMASEQCGGEIQLKQWNEYINWLEKHKEIK